MKDKFALRYSLDLVAAAVAIAAIAGVIESFVIGQHFVIPTGILLIAILFGNLARFGFRDAIWAKHILFWFGVVVTCHTFFALFWAKTPRELLGSAFLPFYGASCIAFAYLSWRYAAINRIFAKDG